MNMLLRSLRPMSGLVLLFGVFLAPAHPQVSRLSDPAATSRLSVQESFSDLASRAAADPADAVCARSAVNSTVTDPPVLSSQNGVLEVSFQYQTAVDVAGLTRYCYLYTDSSGNTQEAPTLEVNPGDQLIIHFTNSLPAASESAAHSMHSMKMQPAANAADAACSATSVTSTSTNLHFHGTNVAPVCHQDEVVHTLIQPQEEFDYQVQIPANEPPGVYWYHPHPHGFSDAQVLGGASGAIIVEGIQNVNPVVSGLPQRVFVLRDQALPASDTAQPGNPLPKTDISINYVPILYPSYVPAVIQTGASEQEFWRVLNTAADTILDIAVMDNGQAQPIQIVSVDGVPLTDSSGNPTTTTVTSYVMSPASRVEFIVTTPAVGDTTAQLVTRTWNNGPIGDADPGRPIANIVSSAPASSAAVRRLPAQTHAQALTRFSGLAATTPVTQRTLYFSVNLTLNPPQFYITQVGQTPAVFNMDGPPNITVTEGTVEQWTIQNQSEMDHAFHIHQLHFQTLAINGVAVNDTTLRDTINVPHWTGAGPYPSVTLMMDFRDPNIVGTFVYHCHVLSHEDLGMMGMIQVLPGATTTTLSTSPQTTVSAGTSVTLTATVAPAAGSGTPTGTVTFQNGNTTLGTGTLNSSGVATLATTTLPIGSNTITAAYSGDSSFAASTSASVAIAVTAASTATSLSVSPTTIVFGSNVALTATVTAPAGTGTPGGNVSFLNGSATLGTAALNGSGVATLSIASLPIGTPSITAVYAGNTSFAGSTSAAIAVTVQPPATTTSLTVSPATTTFGASVALTATVAAPTGDGTPSGPVTFENGGAPIGSAALNASGVATLSTTTLPVGSLAITAVYGGSADFAGSTSTAATVTVQPAATATALAASPAKVVTGGSVTLTATVTTSSAAGTPSGSVSFLNSGASIGTAALNGAGVATLNTSSLPIGSLSINATYLGSASFAGSSSAPAAVTVQPEPTTTSLAASPTTVLFGASVALTATVTAASGTPQGNVSFLNGGTTVGTAALNTSGVATLSTTSLPVGTLLITAAYAGGGSFANSASSVATVTVQPLPPDFGIAASPATLSMAPGGTATSTVTITPKNGFDSAVTFTCSGLPSEATCAFNPTSVTPNGTSTVTATATISTTAASAMAHPATRGGATPLYAVAFPGLGALLGLGIFRKRLPFAMRTLGMVAATLAIAAGIGACGGGQSTPSNPGTPAGTGTITVTATSGTTVHTATIALTVSQ